MKQDKRKRAIILVIVTLSTLVLGVVAVVTALRLRELASVPVAPNVPQSQPRAAVPGTVTVDGCFATIVVPPQACGDSCSVDSDCASSGSLVLRCTAVSGQELGRCLNPACPANTTTCLCAPTPTPTPTNTPGPTPTVTPGPSPTATPPPTATVTPGPTATVTPGPSATVTPTPPSSCSESCTTTADCGGGLICSGGMCRNSLCTTEADCSCPTAPEPTPRPELPQAGVSLPGLVVIGGGMILIMVGLLGVWAW